MKRIYVITAVHYDLIRQFATDDSKDATEVMINWMKDFARDLNTGINDVEDIEKEMRAKCYYGSDEDLCFSLDEFSIYYRRFLIQ